MSEMSAILRSVGEGAGVERSPRYGAREERVKVLVVDDDPAVLHGFERILTLAGCEVSSAPNAEDALSQLVGGCFDVIVSDISMPKMSGTEFLRRVRQRDLDVPVILVTGAPSVDSAADAVAYGAFRYLVKPVEPKRLGEVVDRAAKLHVFARARREALAASGATAIPADRAGLESRFDRALAALWMAYQPIVSCRTRAVRAYEALMRTTEAAVPGPGALLEAAERLDRVVDLGQTVRERVVDPFGAKEPEELLFVNLHAHELEDRQLFHGSTRLGKLASKVVLEITERVSLDKIKDLPERIRALRDLGYRIAVDDLGAGYAGLTSFAQLEPEFVKLDMSLIRGVERSNVKKRVISSIQELSRDLGIEVIAEGVETEAERDTLLELGCDLMQGYLFAAPGRPFPRPSWPRG